MKNSNEKIKKNITWKKEYHNDGKKLYRNLNKNSIESPIKENKKYEFVFNFENQKYYCFINAISMEEAIRTFFLNHIGVTYQDVITHREIYK